MKAVIYRKYGSPEVLQLEELPTPEPKEHEVLIKIKATTVTAGDWRLRKAEPFIVRLFFGFTQPRNPILGHELAGEVVAIGTKVSKYKIGDEVFGSTGTGSGTYAEYIALPENALLAAKPPQLSFKEAASLPVGVTTAWHFLQKAKIKPGVKVLIHGASGSVGSAAIQLAKHLGTEVTAVCSTANTGLVKSLGADYVIDYKKTDFWEVENVLYDVVFNTVGKTSYSQCKKILKKQGIYLASDAPISDHFQGLWAKHKIVSGLAKEEMKALECVNQLITTGKFKPVIDRCYKLEEMAAAHEYVEKGHKKGNVAVLV